MPLVLSNPDPKVADKMLRQYQNLMFDNFFFLKEYGFSYDEIMSLPYPFFIKYLKAKSDLEDKKRTSDKARAQEYARKMELNNAKNDQEKRRLSNINKNKTKK